MNFRADNRGCPFQEVCFPAGPLMGRNFLTPGHPIVRKSVVSIKFPPVILGPEMVAPILWAPGIFWFFLLENPPCP